ncbi:MAG: hypothetical protein NWF03_06210 [Candidatus Bathyarchaeota archaeon]|nr:hypothetical protein [Candidatus Bathyarchaeota archaeon]
MTKDGPLKFGLFLVALTWFLFTIYQFIKSAIYGATVDWPFWMLLTDNASVVSLGFRTMGGLIAVVAVLFYLFNRDLSKPEATMTLRWILVAEALYWMPLFLSGLWGLLPTANDFVSEGYGILFVIETGVPCMLESLIIPFVLIKLFLALNPNKPAKGAIKWGLISGTAFIFVFWLDNTVNWIAAIIEKGIEYVTAYPLNILSFGMTCVGLLLLTLYSAYFSRKSFGAETLSDLDLPKIGAIIICLGLYFDIIYVMWLLFGSVGGWGTWYAWILGHNMNLWAVALPLAGLPLLFYRKKEL